MSMLSEILATKRNEVEKRRKQFPLEQLQEQIAVLPPTRDFRGALAASAQTGTALIAEVKKASPSKGVIRENFDPLEIAQIYAANGATCLSVLTDEPYFQGRLDYLKQIQKIVSIPLLRKDFMIDAWQMAESRASGADAILLIVAALRKSDLSELLLAAREYGLAALVEVHDGSELDEALEAGADLIGINNRDLHTFRTTLATTQDLMASLPPNANRIVVSESGIFMRADVETVQQCGAQAVLVGEALMREADIGAKLRELLGR